MNPQIIDTRSISQIHNSRPETIEPNALVAGSPEYQRLVLFQE